VELRIKGKREVREKKISEGEKRSEGKKKAVSGKKETSEGKNKRNKWVGKKKQVREKITETSEGKIKTWRETRKSEEKEES